MDQIVSKTIAVFSKPFTFPGFDELLPAGEYEIETELSAPPDYLNPEAWKASVLICLHPRESHPGLARTLTVSLADLDRARAKDKLSSKELSQFLLDQLLADPMVQLIMRADGVSETQLRHLYSDSLISEADDRSSDQSALRRGCGSGAQYAFAVQAAENEGMPVRPLITPRTAGRPIGQSEPGSSFNPKA
ncbi:MULTISPECIES: hypothetical protein [unclassified Ruegeria]|uniref:hypothetical protein n=1 Tax=unclassified Ruegeria TaxID=2625375 RepID=UPI001490B64F|nr:MULTISPECIES: hypothetical protein [unclassified Ruegeria]NOD37138.1 hypothetical protein [Ruegeria sp. HKCCD7296]NOE44288.1 hypothetical protein [Ruegeria sp. HKCCD7319]